MEYKFGTAGVRVPSLEQLPVPSGMEAIQALAKTLQISNREALITMRLSNMMREQLNQPDVQEEDET